MLLLFVALQVLGSGMQGEW